MGIDQDTIEKLRAEHGPGKLHLLPDPSDEGEEIIVRPCTRPEWQRFQNGISDAARAGKALEQLIRDCLVHPSRADLDAMFDRRPGLADTWGKALAEISGASRRVEAKKL
jgi:hypothetical protein